ncbi:hypothetical protein EVAR_46557_1 [Eumeta japonica]|uniref:Uncharacterized protein n=1 Tax=Eumeta variegata TaxID=151549 RepID=A0A4C1XMC7_EUMVA|nr:hypothetical protein EVAR_46557_1 [Eumeta japonica]
MNDDVLILRRKKQNADRVRAYRKRKNDLGAMPSTSPAQSDCLLSLKNGMASPQPVFLKNDEFLAPDAASGDIVVKRGTTVTAACPGKPAGNNFIVLSNTSAKVDVLQLQCVSQRTFRGGGWTGDFGDVKCRAPPWFTGQATSARCYGGHRVARYEHRPLPVTGDEGDRPPPRLTTQANKQTNAKTNSSCTYFVV